MLFSMVHPKCWKFENFIAWFASFSVRWWYAIASNPSILQACRLLAGSWFSSSCSSSMRSSRRRCTSEYSPWSWMGFWSLSLLGELGFLMLFAVARAGWSRSRASTSTWSTSRTSCRAASETRWRERLHQAGGQPLVHEDLLWHPQAEVPQGSW